MGKITVKHSQKTIYRNYNCGECPEGIVKVKIVDRKNTKDIACIPCDKCKKHYGLKSISEELKPKEVNNG